MTTDPGDDKPAAAPVGVDIPAAVRAIAKRTSGVFDRDQELAAGDGERL